MNGWKGEAAFPCSSGYRGDKRRSIHTNEVQLENNGHT